MLHAVSRGAKDTESKKWGAWQRERNKLGTNLYCPRVIPVTPARMDIIVQIQKKTVLFFSILRSHLGTGRKCSRTMVM